MASNKDKMISDKVIEKELLSGSESPYRNHPSQSTQDGAEDAESGSIVDKENDLPFEQPSIPEGILGRVLSKTISNRSLRDPGPPPDGGLVAWTQVAMGHITVLNTWGYINSFGVFQTYYVSTLHHPPSDISWVGSIQIFLLFFIGTLSGRATDYGLFRHAYLLGSILQVLGVFMTSLCTRYWQLFLAQGVCTGIGNGLLFCPMVAIVSTYFSKKRAFAIAIVASGTAPGGVIFPIIVQQLLPRIGFPWTIRILAFVMLALQTIGFAFAKPRLPPRKTGPLIEWPAFRESTYSLFCLGMFLVFWSLYFGFYYIGSFGRDILHISRNGSINLLLIANGVGLFGRLIPAVLADRFFGPLNMLLPFVFTSGLLIFCWAAVDSKTGVIVFGIFYGFFGAGIQGLFPATLTSLTTDISKTGTRIGMCFSVVSFASLTGTPLAGALIQKDNGGYLYAQMFAGSSMLLGCLILMTARSTTVGWKIQRV